MSINPSKCMQIMNLHKYNVVYFLCNLNLNSNTEVDGINDNF